MKKAIISLPRCGLPDEEILKIKERATKLLRFLEFDVIDTFFEHGMTTEDIKNKPLYFLAKSLEKISEYDAVYFFKDYSNFRGCKMEHAVALEYGLETFYEN